MRKELSTSLVVLMMVSACTDGAEEISSVLATSRQALVGDRTLLKNIHHTTLDSQPQLFAEVAGLAYFTAVETTIGRELWRTDGTLAGTVLVADLSPGTASTGFSLLEPAETFLGFIGNDGTGNHAWRVVPGNVPEKLTGAIEEMVAVGDRIFYQGYDASTGTSQLMVMGPSGPPQQLLTGDAINLSRANGKLYFSFSDTTYGRELWESNGTVAGTIRLTDINPGSVGSSPTKVVGLGDQVLFFANDGTHGRELWSWEGTKAFLVYDLEPGSASLTGVAATSMVAAGGLVYFVGNTVSNGRELWATDGKPGAPVLTFEFAAGSDSSDPRYLMVAGDRVYFVVGAANNHLYFIPAGDTTVHDIPDSVGNLLSGVTSLIAAGDAVLVSARPPFASQLEVWRANIRGLTRFGDFGVATSVASQQQPLGYFAARGLVLYAALGSGVGVEPHVFNIRMPQEACPGVEVSGTMVVVNGAAYFAGPNGNGPGSDLWRWASGTCQDLDVNGVNAANPMHVTGWNGKLYMSAERVGEGRELVVFDPASNSASTVKDIYPGAPGSDPRNDAVPNTPIENPQVSRFVSVGTNLYFIANDGNGDRVFRTDGTPTGTVAVSGNYSMPRLLTAGGARLYFAAVDDSTGAEELFNYNPVGNAVGMTKFNAFDGSYPTQMVFMSPNMYVVGLDENTYEWVLWRANPVSSVKLAGLPSGAEISDLQFIASSALFNVGTGNSKTLWRALPTAVGQVAVGGGGSCTNGTDFVAKSSVGGNAYFACTTSLGRKELFEYKSVSGSGPFGQYDHLAATHQVGESSLTPLLDISGRLYVSGDDGKAGIELHQISGGAVISHFDLAAGVWNSNPRQLRSVTGGWVFTVDSGSGPRLWFSDNL